MNHSTRTRCLTVFLLLSACGDSAGNSNGNDAGGATGADNGQYDNGASHDGHDGGTSADSGQAADSCTKLRTDGMNSYGGKVSEYKVSCPYAGGTRVEKLSIVDGVMRTFYYEADPNAPDKWYQYSLLFDEKGALGDASLRTRVLDAQRRVVLAQTLAWNVAQGAQTTSDYTETTDWSAGVEDKQVVGIACSWPNGKFYGLKSTNHIVNGSSPPATQVEFMDESLCTSKDAIDKRASEYAGFTVNRDRINESMVYAYYTSSM